MTHAIKETSRTENLAKSENTLRARTTTSVETEQDNNVVLLKGSRDTLIDIPSAEYATITPKQIVALCKAPRDKLKADAPAIIPSTYRAYNAREHATQREHGSYPWSCFDIDTGNLTLAEVKAAFQAVSSDQTTMLIYSTSGSTADNRKWRVLIPVAQPTLGADYTEQQEALCDLLEEQGITCDRALCRTGQPVFLPNVPPDKRDADGVPLFYQHEIHKGTRFNTEASEPLQSRLQARAEAEAALAKHAEIERQKAAQRRAERVQEYGEGTSCVDAFNAANALPDLMLQYGYVHSHKDHWISPNSASKGASVRVYGDRWCSLTQSDAGIGQAGEVGTWGDAFDLYVHYDHGGRYTDAVTTYARESGMNSQRDVSLDGFDKVPASQVAATQPATDPHPLAKFLDPRPSNFASTEFVIDGVLAAGMTLLAGGWGAGKTSQLVPLMCRAAWLCHDDDELKPKLRRKVIYITEDVGQVRMILRAMYDRGEFGKRADDLEDYFKIVEAERMQASLIARASTEYARLTTRNASEETKQEYDAKPVVVFDTRSAIIHLNDENDNTEAGAVIATLRQGLPSYPMVIVGHLSKALKRADTKDMSGRGAGAWEADVQQVLYLANDDGVRFLDVASPKHRFATKIDGLTFESVGATIETVDVLGSTVFEDVFYGRPTVVALGGRKESREAEKADRGRRFVRLS